MNIKPETTCTPYQNLNELIPKPIYLDHMATTPVDPLVIQEMVRYLGPDGHFGNPSSLHPYGVEALKAVTTAREKVASALGADNNSIIFTSGATESINLAILGAARFYQQKGRHVITMTTEHKAVLDSFSQLEAEGFEVTRLSPEKNGLLDLEVLKSALRKETILVSIMHVNNEIGVIQEIDAIGELLKNKGILFHVDAAQSAGKIQINLKQSPVHLMSFSAHKNYGPKGIGALYICQKPRVRLSPLSFGGQQEQGLRAGTLATHQIVGMGRAFELSESLREVEQSRIQKLRDILWNGIKELPGIVFHGHPGKRIAGILSFSFMMKTEDDLQPIFNKLAVSKTSACQASSFQPSYVLQAIGVSEQLAKNAIRLSIGRFTTEADVRNAITVIRSVQ